MRIRIEGDEEKTRTANWCLEIYLGDYTPDQQHAASIMLHMLLKDDQFYKLMDIVREATGFKINNRNSSRVLAWKKKVKKIGYCEICGSTKNLVAHHKIPWAYSIKGRTDPNNGQCLCRECHRMMHDDVLWLEYMTKKVGENGKKQGR